MALKFIAAVVLGYLIGSIPWGILVTRKKAGVDIRQFGSGKMGTTNVLRTAGTKAAALVFILDMLKGAVSAILGGFIVGREGYLVIGQFGLGTLLAQVLAALAAITGHIWPIFVKFRGGRGVATFFGGLVALCPPVALLSGEVVALSVGLTRFVSIGSIAGVVSSYAILVPLTIMNGFSAELLVYALVGALLVIYLHRDNISRLLAGKERRLGEKVNLPPSPSEKA